jgi:hypothetical protein
MRASVTYSVIRSAAIGFALAAVIGVQGAVLAQQNPNRVTVKRKKLAVAAIVSAGNVAGLLDQAYSLLSSADHDYKGHRIHAMRAIKAAVRELGATLRGEGKVREKQGASDAQLRSAQSLLQQALGGLAGRAQRHVAEAIKQLNIALTVK